MARRDAAHVPGPPADVVLTMPRLSSGAARRWARVSRARAAVPALGTAAMGAIVGLAVAIVLVAAERPSILSGPAQRGFPGWMVGPLAHRLPVAARQPADARRPTSRARSRSSASRGWWPCCARRGCPSAIVWSAVVATHVTLLLGPPLSLTDVFNYLHYGRMPATYGVNPYAALPLTVRQDPAYHFSNWHHLPSPYGPLFTLVTEGLAPLSLPAAYWAWKGVLLAAALGTLVLVALHGAPARPLPAGRGRARRAQPARPRLRHRRRPQRAARAAVQRRRGRRWRSSAGRTGPRRGGTSAPAPAPSWPPGFKPSAALLAPVVILACRRRLPALGGAGSAGVLSSPSSGWSTAATCPRRASRTGSSDR